jgi:hypothetical protein
MQVTPECDHPPWMPWIDTEGSNQVRAKTSLQKNTPVSRSGNRVTFAVESPIQKQSETE